MKKGFSLIEILVFTIILVVVGAMGIGLFFTILKSSSKSQVLAEVKQNGSYALSVMERRIRNAKTASLPTPNGTSLELTYLNNSTETFTCDSVNLLLMLEGEPLISDKLEVANDCLGVFSVVAGESGVTPDEVTVDFRLSQAGVASRPEEEMEVRFFTSVVLRNY